MYLEAERRRLYENKNNKLFRILNINSPYYDYFSYFKLNIPFFILKSGHNRANFTDKKTSKDEN